MDRFSTIKSIKEFGRTFLMGIVPTLLDAAIRSSAAGRWEINEFYIQTTIVISFLSAINTLLYERKKEEPESRLPKGITPF